MGIQGFTEQGGKKEGGEGKERMEGEGGERRNPAAIKIRSEMKREMRKQMTKNHTLLTILKQCRMT